MSKFVFTARNTVDATFSSSAFCRFSVEVDCNRVNMNPIAGRSPTVEEFFSAVIETVFDVETVPYADRVNPYRVVVRTGYSGAQDYILEEYRDGVVRRHPVLHISMCGKINDPVRGVYLDDLLMVLNRLGWLEYMVDMEGKKSHIPSPFLKEKFVQMVKEMPRDISQEDGWCYPDGDFLPCGEGSSVLPDIGNRCGGYRVESIVGRLEKVWGEVETDLNEISNG